MPVVINDFEVTPEPSGNERTEPNPQAGARDRKKFEPTDYEIERMLERRSERLERISAR